MPTAHVLFSDSRVSGLAGSILEGNLHSNGSGVCIWDNPLGLENGERMENVD